MKSYLLVEGITDVAFIKYILLDKEIIKEFDDFQRNKNSYSFENLIIIDLGGQDNLLKELIFLKDQQENIASIGIIQDADDDFDKSQKNIEDAIANSKIDESKVVYFLTPNNKDLGDLETLLLSTIEENNIIRCFDTYKNCLSEEEKDIYHKAINKGAVYAYTMYSQKGHNLYKPQDSFMYKIDNKYIDTKLWDLDNIKFKAIKSFIEKVFE